MSVPQAQNRFLVQGGRTSATYLAGATIDMVGPAAANLGFPGALVPNVQQYQLTGGQDGTAPVGAAALTGNLAAKTGISALEDVDLVNILCIPRAAELPDPDMQQVYSDATT